MESPPLKIQHNEQSGEIKLGRNSLKNMRGRQEKELLTHLRMWPREAEIMGRPLQE